MPTLRNVCRHRLLASVLLAGVGALYLTTEFASDAQTGATAWRFKAPAPLLSGVTPTAGGVVFFGDMAGRAYALDAESGEELWTHDLGGAAGGGVITYTSGGRQRVAYAAGMTSPMWPTTKTTGRIIVLGVQ